MQCAHDMGQNGREFFERFYVKVNQNRIPVSGAIELTSRCNLRCIHCYVTCDHRCGRNNPAELSARWWMDLIDQIADAGCLFLLFTGGECLLRPDFPEIYRHACKKGLLVTVFSNGTSITEKVMDVFEKYPPHSVEISLYGATAVTYEKITHVAGSFEKCKQGIDQIFDHGFHLKLKTMLLNMNIHELAEMEVFAADMGVPFRFDAMISPRLDGDPAPLNYRVRPEQVVAKEFADQKRAKQQHDFYYRMNRQAISTDLYVCGAGMNMFHIDAFGIMRPCMMVPGRGQSLLNRSFKQIWHSEAFTQFSKKEKAPEACQTCDKKMLCGYCPGFFQLESGSAQVVSEYLCDLGRMRKQAILNFHTKETTHDQPAP